MGHQVSQIESRSIKMCREPSLLKEPRIIFCKIMQATSILRAIHVPFLHTSQLVYLRDVIKCSQSFEEIFDCKCNPSAYRGYLYNSVIESSIYIKVQLFATLSHEQGLNFKYTNMIVQVKILNKSSFPYQLIMMPVFELTQNSLRWVF